MEQQVAENHLEHKLGKRRLEVYYREIVRISKSRKLTDRALVEAARSKSSPLHDYFEWDDRKCGAKFREHQARQLMSQIRVVYAEGGDARAFMHIDTKDKKKGEWVESSVVRATPKLLESVVDKALKELEWWTERYQTFDGLDEVANGIRKVVESFRKGKIAKAG